MKIGNFLNGIRNGFMRLIKENGSIFEGYFVNNVEVFRLYKKNGEALEITK